MAIILINVRGLFVFFCGEGGGGTGRERRKEGRGEGVHNTGSHSVAACLLACLTSGGGRERGNELSKEKKVEQRNNRERGDLTAPVRANRSFGAIILFRNTWKKGKVMDPSIGEI
jgi:hypothetical protein